MFEKHINDTMFEKPGKVTQICVSPDTEDNHGFIVALTDKGFVFKLTLNGSDEKWVPLPPLISENIEGA